MTKAARKLDTSVPEKGRLPAHEVIYRQLRDLVLFGDLAPGQPVTIQGLTDRLGAGMTPVREAIRRLISEDALVFQGNRRVTVPDLGVTDLKELIFIRKSIESELSARAALRIGPAGIAMLEQIDAELDRAILAGDIKGYLTCNH